MVESPKGKYNGQKLIKLVATKIPASTNNTIATANKYVCEIKNCDYNSN